MIPIVIEQRHIDEGVRCNSGRCPVALAAMDALMCAVDVDWWQIEFTADGVRDSFALPQDVGEVVAGYDKQDLDLDHGLGNPMYPFGFLAPLMFDDDGNPKRIELAEVV